MSIVVVPAGDALDPIVPSPLVLPLLFTGMSYPRSSALISCAVVLLGQLGASLLQRQEVAYSACLMWTAAMCLWHASNRP